MRVKLCSARPTNTGISVNGLFCGVTVNFLHLLILPVYVKTRAVFRSHSIAVHTLSLSTPCHIVLSPSLALHFHFSSTPSLSSLHPPHLPSPHPPSYLSFFFASTSCPLTIFLPQCTSYSSLPPHPPFTSHILLSSSMPYVSTNLY